jgi:N-acetylglucosamine-6-sulfatase
MPARIQSRSTRARLSAVVALAAMTPGLAGAATTRPAATAPSRPNIVVVNTDDQRFDSLYACLAAPPDGRTPPTGSRCPMPGVRDDLIAHGVTFAESFVTTALCCPSRASLFTGLYAHHTGVLTNAKPTGGFSAFRNLQGSTLATWLHRAGYRTSLVGKYLNQYDTCERVPVCRVPPGWDDWHAEMDEGDAAYTNFTLAESIGQGEATATTYPSPDYSTTVLGEKAVAFVKDALTNHPGRPLFLYYAPFAPHPAAVPAPGDEQGFDGMPDWRPPSWNRDPTDGPTWSTDTSNNPFHDPATAAGAAYIADRDAEHRNEMASLLEVDRQVHAIVRTLGCDSACDTLFVFTSDNGISWGEHRYFDKKDCEFEECHRVPMVVRFDPLTDPTGSGLGRVDAAHAVLNVDVAPTVADAALLTDAGAADGRSFLSLLDGSPGNDPPDWRTAVFGEDFGGLVKTAVHTQTLRLIRTLPGDPAGPWKYVELCALADASVPCPTAERELYDESGDPFELTNSAVAAPPLGSVQAELAGRLAELAATGPPSVTFLSGPAPATPSTSASISFGATGGSRFWCSLDAAPRTRCVSPVDVPGPLADGPHSLAVVADGDDPPDGVVGTSAVRLRAWTVDTRAPDPSVTSPRPGRLLRGTSVTVRWEYRDPAPSSGPGTFALLQRRGTGEYETAYRGTAHQRPLAGLHEGTTYCWKLTAADPAGNAATSAHVCAGVPVDDRNPSIATVGPANLVADPGAFDGTLTRLAGAGARADVTLTAGAVGVMFRRGPAAGKADVYLDGTLVKTVDLYSASTLERRYAWSVRFGAVQRHAISVRWTGRRNASSTGASVPVDGVGALG